MTDETDYGGDVHADILAVRVNSAGGCLEFQDGGSSLTKIITGELLLSRSSLSNFLMVTRETYSALSARNSARSSIVNSTFLL